MMVEAATDILITREMRLQSIGWEEEQQRREESDSKEREKKKTTTINATFSPTPLPLSPPFQQWSDESGHRR
jgi:hypothetical protein